MTAVGAPGWLAPGQWRTPGATLLAAGMLGASAIAAPAAVLVGPAGAALLLADVMRAGELGGARSPVAMITTPGLSRRLVVARHRPLGVLAEPPALPSHAALRSRTILAEPVLGRRT